MKKWVQEMKESFVEMKVQEMKESFVEMKVQEKMKVLKIN